MSKATETAAKMIESLPEGAQERVVEELRALVEDAQDEGKWDDLITKKKDALIAAARKARKEIADGRSTDEEIMRWTKSHDVFDRLETGVSEVVEDHSDLDQVLREAIFQDNTAQLNMRLPPAMKAVLSKLARQRTADATTLARIWLAERLERELKAG
jgi:hypothetical protein